MAVADFLEKVGSGLEKGAKAVGTVLEPVAKRTAEVVSGQAPELDAEARQRQYALEDAQINAKAQQLENQLAMGEKYGTLDAAQRQQYVDAITNLYSHPRHAATLMEKLRKAIHPNGAVATPSSVLPTLADATPRGGTAYADDQLKIAAEQRKAAEAEALAEVKAQIAAKYHKPAGKSPPLPGNQLPPEAVGVDGQPIPPEARDAAHSFVEWNGTWWPVAKPKPVFKTVKGHSVLVDPQSGSILRDLGPTGTAKVSTRQTLQPGDDGQMHLVNLTTVTSPSGEKIDVEPGESEAPAEKPESAPKSPSKTPGKGVGALIKPTTGVKPVTKPPGGPAGPVVPGLSTLAKSKNPLYKADVATYKKANDDLIAATKLSSLADQVAQNPRDAVNQKRLAVALERQASGRFTTQALEFVIKAGWGNTIEQWANNPTTGALPADVMRQLVDGAHQNLKAAQDAVKTAQGELGTSPADGGQPKVIVVSPEDMK